MFLKPGEDQGEKRRSCRGASQKKAQGRPRGFTLSSCAMKCSLCGSDAAAEVHCVLCAKAFAAGQTAERAACIEIIEGHDSCDLDTALNALNARGGDGYE